MFQFTSRCPVILWMYMRNELIQTNLAGYTLLFSHYSLRLSLKSNQITRESQWVFIKSNHFCLVSFAPWCCHSKSGSQRPYALHSASSSLSSIVHTLNSQDGLHSNTLLYQQPIVSGPRPRICQSLDSKICKPFIQHFCAGWLALDLWTTAETSLDLHMCHQDPNEYKSSWHGLLSSVQHGLVFCHWKEVKIHVIWISQAWSVRNIFKIVSF